MIARFATQDDTVPFVTMNIHGIGRFAHMTIKSAIFHIIRNAFCAGFMKAEIAFRKDAGAILADHPFIALIARIPVFTTGILII